MVYKHLLLSTIVFLLFFSLFFPQAPLSNTLTFSTHPPSLSCSSSMLCIYRWFNWRQLPLTLMQTQSTQTGSVEELH